MILQIEGMDMGGGLTLDEEKASLEWGLSDGLMDGRRKMSWQEGRIQSTRRTWGLPHSTRRRGLPHSKRRRGLGIIPRPRPLLPAAPVHPSHSRVTGNPLPITITITIIITVTMSGNIFTKTVWSFFCNVAPMTIYPEIICFFHVSLLGSIVFFEHFCYFCVLNTAAPSVGGAV